MIDHTMIDWTLSCICEGSYLNVNQHRPLLTFQIYTSAESVNLLNERVVYYNDRLSQFPNLYT